MKVLSSTLVIFLLLNNSSIVQSAILQKQETFIGSKIKSDSALVKNEKDVTLISTQKNSQTHIQPQQMAQGQAQLTAPMLMSQLDSGLTEVTKLAYGDHQDDQRAARKKVNELKNTLKQLKEQVIQESGNSKNKNKSNETNNKISTWIKQIAKKIPQITKLEKKLGMLQGLDPVMEGIVNDLDKVTDFSTMIKLKKEYEENRDEEGNQDPEIEGLVNQVSNSAVRAAKQLKNPDSSSERMNKIKGVIQGEMTDDHDHGEDDSQEEDPFKDEDDDSNHITPAKKSRKQRSEKSGRGSKRSRNRRSKISSQTQDQIEEDHDHGEEQFSKNKRKVESARRQVQDKRRDAKDKYADDQERTNRQIEDIDEEADKKIQESQRKAKKRSRNSRRQAEQDSDEEEPAKNFADEGEDQNEDSHDHNGLSQVIKKGLGMSDDVFKFDDGQMTLAQEKKSMESKRETETQSMNQVESQEQKLSHKHRDYLKQKLQKYGLTQSQEEGEDQDEEVLDEDDQFDNQYEEDQDQYSQEQDEQDEQPQSMAQQAQHQDSSQQGKQRFLDVNDPNWDHEFTWRSGDQIDSFDTRPYYDHNTDPQWFASPLEDDTNDNMHFDYDTNMAQRGHHQGKKHHHHHRNAKK